MNFEKFLAELFCRTPPSNHFSHVVFSFLQISEVCSLKSEAGEVEKKKEKLKNLLMCGKFSFHVMVDRELFTYVKNKK